MKMIKTKFKDLLIIQNKSFKDNRGYFKELYKETFLNKKFPFMVMSYSKKNVFEVCIYKKTNNKENMFL